MIMKIWAIDQQAKFLFLKKIEFIDEKVLKFEIISKNKLLIAKA